MIRKAFWGALVMTLIASTAAAEIVTETISYKHGELELQGFLAYDKGAGKRPGVLLVHEWWGLTDHTKNMARKVAEMGYVAFAVDMYGGGQVTDKTDEAGKLAGQFKGDAKRWRERAKAGYDALIKTGRVDEKHIAAIGFCFGGSTCLQMAYSGLPLAGIVTFHGGLMAPAADDPAIKAKVLVLHGADDPLVPTDAVSQFQEAMRARKVDWQMVYYGNTVHSFTNPGADKVGIDGVAYNASSDKRAWRAAADFFREVLGPTDGSKKN